MPFLGIPREPQRPETPADALEEKPSDRFPWRALVLGALILPPLTLFGHLSYIIVQSAVWTAHNLLRGPLILLFLLVCWTLLWRRFSPRLARRLSLTRSDLVLVYLMTAVGTALAGECWALWIVPGLAGTAAYHADSSNPEWAAWLAETPRWFTIQDPEVIRAIHRGNSTLYQAAHLRALAVPVLAWGVLMLSLAIFTQCLAQLFRKQWIQRERLSFPLIHLPLTLADTEAPNPWWRNRLFWTGAAIAGGIQFINGLNYLFPTIPYIPVKMTQFPAAADRPWSGLGPVWIAFYPWVIAVGFMVPLEVSFSMWFFFWMSRVQDMVFTVLGHRTAGGFAPGLPPYHVHQGAGAFLVLGAILLWRIRKDSIGLWGKALDPANRRATWGVLISACVALIWATAAHIPVGLALAFLVVYGLFAIVLARLIAESGCAASLSSLSINETVALQGNMGDHSRQTLISFGWWHNLGERQSDSLMPHQITGMRLAQDVRAENRVHLFLAVGALVGVFAGMWSLLHIYFQYGIMSAQVRNWPARVAPQLSFRLIHNWLQGQTQAPRDRLVAFVFGGVIAALLVWLRQAYLGWPLHPIGFVVASNWGMQQLWCPFFVAWGIKLIAMRFGGIRTYRALLPLFLGLILGDFLIPMIWAVIGLLTGEQMYLSFPH